MDRQSHSFHKGNRNANKIRMQGSVELGFVSLQADSACVTLRREKKDFGEMILFSLVFLHKNEVVV